LDLVLDGLVEGASHALEREHRGEGEIGVDTVLESDRGNADEVVATILAYGGVDGEVNVGSFRDVDRIREDCKVASQYETGGG